MIILMLLDALYSNLNSSKASLLITVFVLLSAGPAKTSTPGFCL